MSDCVHYYKDAMLGRFYAIRNCCSCCCEAMQAHQRGTPIQLIARAVESA